MTVQPVPPPVPAVIPARMLNEFTYCPRLAWLEWVQGEWADNVETIEGSHVHRRVDTPEGDRAKLHSRSIHLSSETLGATAVIDLLERDGRRVRPVDYKRGKKPPVADGAWEPERVQLCIQGLLLREHGYECNEGLLYFAASRDRVRVRFTVQLVERTLALLAQFRATFASGAIPPPLEDSPKCPRCSLVSICLPEEVNFLRRGGKVRPIAVGDPGTHPLVVQEPGSEVRLCGSRLRILRKGKEEASVPIERVSQLILMSGCHASSAVFRLCLERGILIVHMSGTGWLYGITRGATHKNVQLREEQFAAARDGERRLAFARQLIAAKIHNCRVLLRRNAIAIETRPLELLRGFADQAARAPDLETLLGIEGTAARLYYAHFAAMLKANGKASPALDLDGRNRRPPKDPINALLSFAYSTLVREWVTALETVGFDPMEGFLHASRYGKPALALDLMEPFRPVIADSTVIGILNNGEIGADAFYAVEGGILLKPAARKVFLQAWERRVATEAQHPLFGYRCNYRRIFELEARLAGRWILGELARFDGYRVR